MDNQELANSILQDILAIPTAPIIASVVTNALNYNKYDKDLIPLAQWLITGQNPPEFSELFGKTVMNLYISGKDKSSIIDPILRRLTRYLMGEDDVKVASSLLLDMLARRPDAKNIVKHLKLSNALASLPTGPFDGSIKSLTKWLLTGVIGPPIDPKPGIDFLVDPENAQEEIIREISQYNGTVLDRLTLLLAQSGTQDEINELEQLPEKDKLPYLLDTLERHLNIRQVAYLEDIRNFFR